MAESLRAVSGALGATLTMFSLALMMTSGPADAFTGHALGLQGAGHVEIDDTPLLHGSDELTLSAWFRVDQLRGWQALLWKGDMPDRHPWNNREFGLFIEESGYVHLCSTPVSRQRRGQLYVNTPGGTVRPGQWFHVAAVVSSDLQGGVMRIYVNGELSASRPYDRSGVRDSIGPLWLGGIPRTGAGFHGLIDDVRIWRRALNANEIRHQMLGQMENTRGLMAHYTFEQVDPSGALIDLSGHRHRGHHNDHHHDHEGERVDDDHHHDNAGSACCPDNACGDGTGSHRWHSDNSGPHGCGGGPNGADRLDRRGWSISAAQGTAQ